MTAEKPGGFNFYDMVKTTPSSLGVREVIGTLVRKVNQLMNGKGCSLHLFDPERKRWELVASHGLCGDDFGKDPVEADQRIVETLVGNTVWVSEATKFPGVQYEKEAVGEGRYGVLSVPLSVEGQVVGMLRLYTPEPRTFLKGEIDFAEAMAEMGANILENIRRYESLRRDYEYVVNDIFTFYGFRRGI